MSYKNNDPRKIPANFCSTCSKCKEPIKKGEIIVYFPTSRDAMHEKCGEADYNFFLSTVQDEELYNSHY